MNPLTVSISQDLLLLKPKGEVINVFSKIDNNKDKFDRNWPVIDEIRSNMNRVERIPFSLDCSGGTKCNSNLVITTKFYNVK